MRKFYSEQHAPNLYGDKLNLTDKAVNWRSKYITQVQQQRPESPTVTLTWHAYNYKVHKLHQRWSLTCPYV